MNPTQTHPPSTYHPSALMAEDRRRALREVRTLPTQSSGALLFADIVGFTTLLEQVETRLGAKKGADVMTEQVNRLFTALIEQTHEHGGVVIAFGGDAISCWFAQTPGDDAAWQAVCCGLAMQRAMQNFAQIEIPSIAPFSFALKVTIAAGKAIRLVVGDPQIQCFDLVAGEVVSKLTHLQPAARAGGLLLDGESARRLATRLTIAEWINHQPESMAIITAITVDPPPVEPVTALAFPTLPEELEKAWLLRPVYERLANGQGYFISELRSVVFLFLKFAGLHYQSDPEAGDKVDRYLRTMQQTLTALGGYLLKVTIDDKGSYLLAAFGAPLSHEADLVNRALRAALRLRQQSQRFDFIEHLAISISQAQLLAGIFGAPQRAAFDLLGKEVNLLNRVVNQMPAGQIVVTQVIEAQARQKYTFGPATALRLRGITEAVAIFELLSTHLPPLPTLHHEWIGRVAEQQTLNDLWQKVVAQQGQILEIEGGAGLGKSHLAIRFLQSLSSGDGQIVYAACESTTQQTPYSLWRLIVPQLVAITHTVDATHWDDDAFWANTDSQEKASSPLQTLLPNNRQETIFADLLALIRKAVTATQSAPSIPLVLVLDDLHWIDEASYKLTVSLSRQIADLPIFLILLRRPLVAGVGTSVPELSYLSHYQRLVIAEFSDDEVAELLATRLSAKVSPLLLSLVTMLAQGNPFFVDELLLTLQSQQLLQEERDKAQWTLAEEGVQRLKRANCLHRSPQSGDWLVAPDAPLTAVDLGLPHTIEQSILARLDQLAEPVRFTLKLASVVGRTFSPAVLLAAHPNRIAAPALQAQLQLLVQHNLLLPPPEDGPDIYAFRHHLTQESVYTSLTATDRQRLHSAVGQALETLAPQGVEALAEHYWQGAAREKALETLALQGVEALADHYWQSVAREKAIHYLAQAAQRAQRSSANQTALNYYNRLLELQERREWLMQKVEVLHALSQREEEKQLLDQLTASDESIDAELYQRWGAYYEAIGDYASATDAVETARQHYHAMQNETGEIDCLILLGIIARRRGDYQSSRSCQEEALQTLLNHQHPAALTVKVYNELGAIYRQQGDYPAAIEVGTRALELSRAVAERTGEVDALTILGWVAFYQRNFVLARQYQWQALQIHRVSDNLTGEGNTLYSLGAIDFETGDYSQAEAYFLEALTKQRITQNRWEEVNLLNVLGILSYQLGDYTDAQRRLRAAIDLSRQIADKGGEASALCNLGQLLRDQGKVRAAEKRLRISLFLAKRQDDKHLLTMCQSHLALTYLYASQPRKAIRFATQAIKTREHLATIELTTFDHATLALAYWQTKKRRLALAHVEKTYQILNDCQAIGPEFPQRDYLICAQLWQANAQTDKATHALERAHQLLRQRAVKISDPNKQASFLQNIRWHAEIIGLATDSC